MGPFAARGTSSSTMQKASQVMNSVGWSLCFRTKPVLPRDAGG
eukprot:CAMPEP_0113985622 /NCGR_PEP_ID=MMETSP0328-20130328/6029_1 /TAXON_ID=39455 /ORGANISM="Alexandrium minutum" /LENGTH=42 /assembly_acc=CAM_ASM_000350